MKHPSNIIWITEGKPIQISRRSLKRGCFYLCEPFFLKSKESTNPGYFVVGKEILVPTIDKNLKLKPAWDFAPLSECHSYPELDDEHRFEYVAFLQEQVLPCVSNKSLIEYYLKGIAIRLFLDNNTTEAERVQIFKRLLVFYSGCLKYRKLIEPLVASAFCRFFIKIDEGNVMFFPRSRSIKTNQLINDLAKYFHRIFCSEHQLRSLLSSYGSYIINGIDSKRKPVTVEIPLPNELIKTPKVKTKVYEAYERFALKQREIKELEERAKHPQNTRIRKSAVYSLLTQGNSHNDKTIAIVKAFYNRIIAENEYITTNYAEIVESFGFTENSNQLTSHIFSDEVLELLSLWGIYTYPDLRKLNLVLYRKSPCVLYKDRSDTQVIKTSRYKTLQTYIKLALYVVQEDEYNWNDIQHIKHFIIKHSPNERTKNELVSVLLLSLKDVQRLSALKQEVGNIEKPILNDLIISLKTLAYVDGDITRERKDQLEWLLPLLGYNVRNLSSELRQILPVDYSKKQPIQVSLDLSMLKKLREDTVLAHQLLSEIFVDETEESVKHDNTPTHISLLKHLLNKDIWLISEVKNLCQEYGMMYGAFIEKANLLSLIFQKTQHQNLPQVSSQEMNQRRTLQEIPSHVS